MSKKIKITLLVLALIIVVGSISLAAISVYKPDVLRNVFSRPYSAVYLSTGEMYIGKLSIFPRHALTDAYLLQIVPDQTDPTKKSFQLAPLKDALWSPQEINLNEDNIVFTAPIRDDSQVVKTIKSK